VNGAPDPRADGPLSDAVTSAAPALPSPALPSPALARPRARPGDLLAAATIGLRARKLRSLLSALAITVGIAAIVTVLGITRSSESALLAQIDRLGTNLLTVANGQSISGQEVELPAQAPGMIGRLGGVLDVAPTAELSAAGAFRTDKVPSYETNGLGVRACDASLPAALGATTAQGSFLNAATAHYPAAVLGYQAARALGVTRLGRPTRISVSGHWLTVVGILNPSPLAPEIDSSVLIGFPVARQLFGYDGHPGRVYVRAVTDQTAAVAALLARQAWPAHPEQVQVSRPSDALTARIAVQDSGTSLFLGLGAVAVLAGGLGIANVMVISVLERRPEIGLRRAIGATRGHVALQFLLEAMLLSGFGGLGGLAVGAAVTFWVSQTRGWTVLIPPLTLWGGLGLAMAVGMLAGCYPALRAARLSPADALRSN
jgi:putative ABC transport system permease protein